MYRELGPASSLVVRDKLSIQLMCVLFLRLWGQANEHNFERNFVPVWLPQNSQNFDHIVNYTRREHIENVSRVDRPTYVFDFLGSLLESGPLENPDFKVKTQ